MKKSHYFLASMLLIFASHYSISADDTRQWVKLPEKMQQHMLDNMRVHLATINQILIYMSEDQLDQAADLAEERLGMTSLESHGARHLAGFMPESMKKAGASMHHAASQFALKAEEGELIPAYQSADKSDHSLYILSFGLSDPLSGQLIK